MSAHPSSLQFHRSSTTRGLILCVNRERSDIVVCFEIVQGVGKDRKLVTRLRSVRAGLVF